MSLSEQLQNVIENRRKKPVEKSISIMHLYIYMVLILYKYSEQDLQQTQHSYRKVL
jgi:hypothetical protein